MHNIVGVILLHIQYMNTLPAQMHYLLVYRRANASLQMQIDC